MGGKSKIANQLIEMFPKDYDLFVEPFVGAGNIFFRIPDDERRKSILNDKDKDIYIVLKGLKSNSEYINDKFNRTKINKEYFNKLKDKFDPVSILEKIKFSFFTKGERFAPSIIKKGVHADFTKFKDKLKNTTILNNDALTVIQKYDKPNTFFYLDPPYENPKQNDYKNYIDPQELYNVLKNIKGKFLLSYNDSKNIRNIFKEFDIHQIKTKYAHTQYIKERPKTELIIKNY